MARSCFPGANANVPQRLVLTSLMALVLPGLAMAGDACVNAAGTPVGSAPGEFAVACGSFSSATGVYSTAVGVGSPPPADAKFPIAVGRIAVGVGKQGGEEAFSVGYGRKIGSRGSFSLGGAFGSDEKSAGVGVGFDL